MDEEMNICREIRQQLKKQKRSVAWLAKEVGCDASNLFKQLNCEKNKQSKLPTTLLYRISVAMDEDFFAHFSQQLYRNKRKSGKNHLTEKNNEIENELIL